MVGRPSRHFSASAFLPHSSHLMILSGSSAIGPSTSLSLVLVTAFWYLYNICRATQSPSQHPHQSSTTLVTSNHYSTATYPHPQIPRWRSMACSTRLRYYSHSVPSAVLHPFSTVKPISPQAVSRYPTPDISPAPPNLTQTLTAPASSPASSTSATTMPGTSSQPTPPSDLSAVIIPLGILHRCIRLTECG